MMQLAKDRSIQEMDEHVAKMQEASQKLTESSDKISESKEKRDLFQQWKAENPKATAEQATAARAKIYDPSVAAADVRAQAEEAKEKRKEQEKTDKEFEKNKQNYSEASDQIGALIDMVDKGGGLGVTGVRGLAERGAETVATMTPAGASMATPASDFKSKLDTLKLQLPKLLTGTSKSAADERRQVDEILRGTSPGDTGAKTRNALVQVKEIFDKRLKREGAYDTQNYKTGDTVMSPDGKRMKITGFDTDGTPLGEEVK